MRNLITGPEASYGMGCVYKIGKLRFKVVTEEECDHCKEEKCCKQVDSKPVELQPTKVIDTEISSSRIQEKSSESTSSNSNEITKKISHGLKSEIQINQFPNSMGVPSHGVRQESLASQTLDSVKRYDRNYDFNKLEQFNKRRKPDAVSVKVKCSRWDTPVPVVGVKSLKEKDAKTKGKGKTYVTFHASGPKSLVPDYDDPDAATI